MPTTFWCSCAKAQSRRRWSTARAAHAPIQAAIRHLTGVADVHAAYGRDLILVGDGASLMADQPEDNIWTWPRQ
jgi:hypothetical protein